MPENGGWDPFVLSVPVGQPLSLRLTSEDVLHSFAVGQMDMTPVDVKPGQVTELTLTFDRPGTYTYYCTRWCGPNHWRMRGTIIVTGATGEAPPPPPLFVQLGLDIDAAHAAEIIPDEKPSVARGAQLPVPVLQAYRSAEYYRSHTPEQAWKDLRAAPEFSDVSAQQLWDMVAVLWTSQSTPAALDEARQLYAVNCAACHGEEGGGDGVFADEYQAAVDSSMLRADMLDSRPTDFTDPVRMLSASPALLQGKLVRGGMGTGMPMWGVIFTEEQTWSLVSYLYTFQFEEAP
jgi:mono/diheme cytochrome c family protein